jgi:phage recombination protein Bet
MLGTLKATAFKGEVSNEQMMALLVVAEQYELNPWTKEIFAFPDKHNGIVPVVGLDGWARIINSNPQFDGMDFAEGELNAKQIPSWIECAIYRKDRSHPIRVKEYFDEVYREPKSVPGPWQSHPRRMLRHKAMIQCARLAFGFAGIYDQDEAERIIDVTPVKIDPRGDTSNVDSELVIERVSQIADVLAQDKDETEIAAELREIDAELNRTHELYIRVLDKLAHDKIISKGKWREYLNVGVERR